MERSCKYRTDYDYLTLAAFRVALREIVSRYDDDEGEPLTGREAAMLALRALQAFPEHDTRERKAAHARWQLDAGD